MSPRAAGAAVGVALAASIGWLGLLAAAPASVGSPTVTGRLSSLAYLAGARVCHQQAARSFAWRGRPQPVCARCLGIYAGVPAGIGLAWLAWRRGGPRPTDRARVRLLAAAALVTAGSVAGEWLGAAAPGLAGRAALGVGLGAVLAWVGASALLDEASEAGGVN
jgi:hypothetical protein